MNHNLSTDKLDSADKSSDESQASATQLGSMLGRPAGCRQAQI